MAAIKSAAKRCRGSWKDRPRGNGMPEIDEQTSLLGGIQDRLTNFSQRLEDEDDNGGSIWVRKSKHVLHITHETLFNSPVNFLLVFVPLGIVAGAVHWPPMAVFVLNFLAIVPLASLLSFATEELSTKLGETIGGLLNATFGNAVELIVSIVALKNNEIRIVQSSMLGSILSNLLLVLGTCFLYGGWKYQTRDQTFNETAASTMSSLLAVASVSLVIPATLFAVLTTSKTAETRADIEAKILVLSRGTAIILLVLYIMYLYFQFKSRASLFATSGAHSDPEPGSHENERGEDAVETGRHENQQGEVAEESPILTPWEAGVLLILITVAVAVCAEYLVDSIDSIVQTTHVSKTFIGLILIPIVGNAAEHVTSVVVAGKDKMNLAIGIAIGSSLQIALSVTPFLVILGWIMDRPMSLHFEIFETVVFFLSVIVVNYLIQDGKSNYLEGAMLLGTYIIIALAFYVYPDDVKEAGRAVWSFGSR